MDLSAYIDAVSNASNREALNALLVSTFDSIGATAVSGYAFPYGGDVATTAMPIISTWPEEVSRIYRSELAGQDPIMYAAMTLGMPVHFLKLEPSVPMTDATRGAFDTMRAAGFVDGVSTPVYARPGSFAYFVAAFEEERPDLTPADLRRIKFLFSEYFYRYSELTRIKATSLSARERQVLVAIVNDKSNAEIATMLGVSEHTVGTYVRRCFEKLDVHSRTQAVLRFLGGGTVDLKTP